jgi:hypothetical protein
MKDGATTTTGSSKPSAKEVSAQGAGTAGSAAKKGDATTPGYGNPPALAWNNRRPFTLLRAG